MTDPIALFDEWYQRARASEPSVPDAVALATADATGMPSVRMVLLKSHGPDGFVFYTNLGSRKGGELADNPRAALCFHWKSLARQVRVAGPVSRVADEEADAYFRTRDRDSQLGAWASRQSQPLPDRLGLEKAVARYAASFGLGPVPRPAWWSGFRVAPETIEFWEELPFRLHRRVRYARVPGGWDHDLLYP